jgi:hypothetical protein
MVSWQKEGLCFGEDNDQGLNFPIPDSILKKPYTFVIARGFAVLPFHREDIKVLNVNAILPMLF